MKHIAALLLLSLASSADAHKDMFLSVSADGSIPQLPARYAKTRLYVEFSEGQSGRLTKLRLASAGQTAVVKNCALDLVSAGASDRMTLAGSSYHDKKLLPDYIHIRFRTDAAVSSSDEPPGVVFLFSLQDARLLEVREVVVLPQGQGVQYREVELKEGCPAR